MSGKNLEGVWKVSGRCLKGVRKTSGGCLKVSGRPVHVHVYRNGRKTRTFVSKASKPPAGARISEILVSYYSLPLEVRKYFCL